MKYENRQAEEGINYSREHPLGQLAKFLIAAVVLLVLVVALLQVSGAWMARLIPFSFEKRVAQHFDDAFGDVPSDSDIELYLNDLADRMMAHMPMPEDMDVTVNYRDEPVFNAFATIGGNLLFYRELIERMPSENALAMVMAHEIAHILHRDPISGLGGGVASTVALLAIVGDSGAASNVLGTAGSLTGVQFTRGMESRADEAALAALNGHYGHVNGAAALFEIMAEARGSDGDYPSWLERFSSSHPVDDDRIAAIARHAADNGWSVTGELTPLPAGLQRWLDGKVHEEYGL
ncbi:MAG: hypothetical protein CSB44_08265 [Gammaproteobacteria bacterium]|nr:MAG: hypothetical protein CSB44_08265 [Gammaproteobacteria bacterium]